MRLSNELCNPNPWDVEWGYHAGRVIVIPADGSVELSVDEMDDFRDGKPGSEDVQSNMSFHGIFLRQHDRPYELQAIEALEASAKMKSDHTRNFEQSLRSARAAQNTPLSDESFALIFEQSGNSRLKKQADTALERARFLRSQIDVEKAASSIHKEYDPERTLLFTNPPKEFPTRLALQMFLNDAGNEDLRARWQEQMGLNETQTETDETLKEMLTVTGTTEVVRD